MDVSIIILSFNTDELTSQCLKSVYSNTKNLDYETIVIDNGSNDGSVASIKKLHFHKLRIIANKKNLGFAAGNNQGINVAKGRYILLLNSDTLINGNTIGNMVKWMDENKQVGIATCSLKNLDGNLQATGGFFPTLFRVFTWMFFIDDLPILNSLIKSFHPHTPDFFVYNSNYLKSREQDWVTGAFFLIRKEVIADIGLFDKEYFMYVEEVDFSFRAKKAGWKVWYVSDWNITHLGGASSSSEFSIISEFKNIQLFFKKHYSKWQSSLLRSILKAGTLIRMLLFDLIGRKDAAKIYAKAFKSI